MRRAVLLVMFLLVFAAASSAFATTYYVDDDATSPYLGTSDQPFLHPQDAADVVDPGDTVIVRDGTYYDSPPDASEPSIIKLSRTNGTSSNPIVFRSENPWGAVLDGDSNAADWGIQIWNPSGNASYVTIEGFEIKDCASSGIHTWDADHVLIKGNHIHHIGNEYAEDYWGRAGFGDSGDSITYDGNVIHHIGRTGPEDHFQLDHGIYPCADYITITNNLIYEVRGFGIGGGAYGHTNDLLISNNTFVWPPNPPGAWRSPIVVTPCPKCVNGEVTENPELDNLTIQNNIFVFHGSYASSDVRAIELASVIDAGVVRNNLHQGPTTLFNRPHSNVTVSDNILNTDPLFVNPSDPLNGGWALQSGSPARDEGISTLAPDHDYDGVSRPQNSLYDIGAYEYSDASYTVNVTPSTVAPGGTITVTWDGPNGGDPYERWLGQYSSPPGACNTWGTWTDAWEYTGGDASGTNYLTASSNAGNYVVKYKNCGTDLATSEPFTVATLSPEAEVKGNGVVIADGDSSPSTSDHTDFGSVDVVDSMTMRTYVINNLGTANLTVGTVTVSGTHAADYTVSPQPAAAVAPSGSTTFTVRFDPSATGTRSAALSFSNNDADENPYNFDIQGSGIQSPEVEVRGNGAVIADGDSSPSTSDWTDFGSADIDGTTVTRTYTINNTGSTNLSVSTVTVSGTHAADYTVTAQPAATVAASGSTTFTVRFDPSATGTRSAALSFSNNDADEDPYNFDIQGTGTTPVVPEMDVRGNGNVIGDGDTTPSTIDHTDFGAAEVSGGMVDRTFTIYNTGTGSLSLSGSPKVAISGTHAADFSVTAQPSSPVASGGGSTTFTVRFDPSATGTRSAALSIANDDSDENPYNFNIQGSGVNTPPIFFADNFEKSFGLSNWITLAGDPVWYTGTPKNGTHSLEFNNNTADDRIEQVISTKGMSDIQVSFFLGASSLDSSSEQISVWWYDGANWYELKTMRGGDADCDGQLHYYFYSLPAAADDNPNFKLWVGIWTSGADDYGYLDDVVISGTPSLFGDNFESGFSGWTTVWGTPAWYTGTPKNGTHSIELANSDGCEEFRRTVSTSGYSNIQVDFFMGASSLESGEFVSAWWYDGSTWYELVRISGGDGECDGTLHFFSFDLPSGANNNPYFMIDFTLSAGDSSDYGYVDDVVVKLQ